MKSSVPKAPAHLSSAAKEEWRRIVEGWDLDDPSLMVLQSYCEAGDTERKAQKQIDKEGLVVFDRFKQPKPHPAFLVVRDMKSLRLRQLKALGLDLEPVHEGRGRPPGR
jgi:P27 family predicted phage terminase small subunit